MTTDKAGGPAFPQHGWSNDPVIREQMQQVQGATLWDMYAAHFASGCSAYSSEVAARFAADFADAMLAERKKRGIV